MGLGLPMTSLFSKGQSKSVILDIDGVLWDGDQPTAHAVEAIQSFRRQNVNFCLLTNDAYSSRHSRLKLLNNAGFDFSLKEIVTASYLTSCYLKTLGVHRILMLGGGDGVDEFDAFEITSIEPEAVVITDYFDYYDRHTLQVAYRALINGALFVTSQKNRHWVCSGERIIDTGFWVSGLEFCTRKEAVLLGKPSAFSYTECLRLLDAVSHQTVMISDDAVSDLAGAKRAGCVTVHMHKAYEMVCTQPTLNADYGIHGMENTNELLSRIMEN